MLIIGGTTSKLCGWAISWLPSRTRNTAHVAIDPSINEKTHVDKPHGIQIGNGMIWIGVTAVQSGYRGMFQVVTAPARAGKRAGIPGVLVWIPALVYPRVGGDGNDKHLMT